MNFIKVLVVEDHPELMFVLRQLLTQIHCVADHVMTIEQASAKLDQRKYDLVVLDRHLPDGDGQELIDGIAESSQDTKILMLTECDAVSDKVSCLLAGADDYLAKPFSGDEFVARVRAVLRRGKIIEMKRTNLGQCMLLLHEAQLEYGSRHVRLTTRESRLLDLFARHPRHVLSREYIATQLWTADQYPSSSSIDTFMKRLRDKLSCTPLKIQTRYNLGYELSIPI